MQRLLAMAFAIALLLQSGLARADIQVGSAVKSISPTKLLPVSGGMGRPKPTTQRRGELTARALVLRKNDTTIAIVALDSLGFPGALADRVRAKVPRIAPQNIMIGSTHTHSAPDCYGFPDGNGGHTGDLDYMQFAVDRAAEAINAAFDKLEPATLKIATGEAKGKIAYNYYAPDLYDRRMSVIQAINAQGKTIATLVNYAIHPEVLGNSVGILSPDLVGPLCEKLEAQTGGTAIFMNGAQGGMITADNRNLNEPRDPLRAYWNDSRTWEECLRIGRLMADEALRIVKDAREQKDPRYFVTRWTCAFRSARSNVGCDCRLAAQLQTQRRPLDQRTNQSHQLGDASDSDDPGRRSQHRLFLKRKMNGRHHLLLA